MEPHPSEKRWRYSGIWVAKPVVPQGVEAKRRSPPFCSAEGTTSLVARDQARASHVSRDPQAPAFNPPPVGPPENCRNGHTLTQARPAVSNETGPDRVTGGSGRTSGRSGACCYGNSASLQAAARGIPESDPEEQRHDRGVRVLVGADRLGRPDEMERRQNGDE